MATILVVTGLDHSVDSAECAVSHTAEQLQGNAVLIQQSLSSSPGGATAQKHNQAPEKVGDHVKKPSEAAHKSKLSANASQATHTSTPEMEHSKPPTKLTLVVKAAKVMDQTKVMGKKQSKIADKESKPITKKKASKVHDKPASLATSMASEDHKVASHGKHELVADKDSDEVKEHAASEEEHETKRKKKHMPEDEESPQVNQSLLFGVPIILCIAFRVFGSPFGAAPTLGETKLHDHPELF